MKSKQNLKSLVVEKYNHLVELPDIGKTFKQIEGNFFYTTEWFENYEEYIKTDFENEIIYCVLKVAEGKSAQELAAILIAKEEIESKLFFNYKKLASFSNYYTTYHNVLVCDNCDKRKVVKAIAEEIDHTNAYSAIQINPIVEGDYLANVLKNELEDKGWFAYFYKMYGNWRLHINGRSFEEYYSTIPTRIRNTIKRKEKKLKSKYSVAYHMYTGLSDLQAAISEFEKVYKNSWKEEEPYPEFIRGLIHRCALAGWLRIGVLKINLCPVAVQFWIVKDNIAYIYKLAYEEKAKEFSAGSILTKNMMQHVIDEDQVDIVDYLTGDDDYKKDWMSERRQIVGLMAFNKTFKGLLLTNLYKIQQFIKNLYKKRIYGQ